MKKVFVAALLLILSEFYLISQTIENTGKPLAEIFTDFHYSLSGDSNTTGFSVTRAYFGYNYFATENFSALIKLDIGNPSELPVGSILRRYAYFKEASLSYKKDDLSISFGITGTRLFDFQQKFWGKRYVANTYQSINGYGFVADLGIVVDYKLNDLIQVDLSLMNGEGYSSLQLDDDLKGSVGVTLTPATGLFVRAYSDLLRTEGIWQSTNIFFLGFRNEKFSIGGEVSYKSNIDLTKGHNAWGLSGTGAVKLTEKIEFFTRYDYAASEAVSVDGSIWNLANNGSFLIPGFQYTFNKYVKMALDYQATFPSDPARQFTDLIYVNAVFKF